MDVDHDDYVENIENPKKKARKTPKSKGVPTSKRRLRTLEHGMQFMQSQLEQIMAALQSPNQIEVPPLRGPWKGAVTWPADLQLAPESITKVPGDGNCLWHSLGVAKGGAQAVGQLPALGMQMKGEVLGWIRGHPGEAGALWGCPPQKAAELATYWEGNWADARALVMAAHLHDVVVLVFNTQDRKIEAFHNGIEPKLEGVVWALLYDGTHYDMMQPPTAREFGQLSQVMQMTPWRHDPKRPHKGGSLGVGLYRLSQAHRHRATLKRAKTRNKPNVKHTQGLDLHPKHCAMTWNIGGMRPNMEHLLYHLTCYSPLFVALQETRLSYEQQGACQQVLKRSNYDVIYGQASRWGINQRNQQYLRVGEVPGVALVSRQDVEVCKCKPLTQGGQELYKKGRLLLAQISDGTREPLQVCVYYAPTGNQGHRGRQQCCESLLSELAAQGKERCIVVGDFNDQVSEMASAGYLQAQRGWMVPPFWRLMEPLLVAPSSWTVRDGLMPSFFPQESDSWC